MFNINEVCFIMGKRGNKAYRSSEKESNLKIGQTGWLTGWLVGMLNSGDISALRNKDIADKISSHSPDLRPFLEHYKFKLPFAGSHHSQKSVFTHSRPTLD